MLHFREWLAKTPQAAQYAAGLLSGQHNPDVDDDGPAYYDAIWGDIPYFNIIAAKQAGHGYGFLAFLHFLNKVGPKKVFSSSDFTPEGNALFDKAQRLGLIAPANMKAQGMDILKRLTYWRVTGNPVQALRQVSGSAS